VHAGEEGVAPRRAALLGIVGHEDRTLSSDAIDVGRFPDGKAAVVDARLHPADVVAHDEKDVGFADLCLRCRREQQYRQRGGTNPEILERSISDPHRRPQTE
jgi:hypothetical protein